jgi:hypothetical protein
MSPQCKPTRNLIQLGIPPSGGPQLRKHGIINQKQFLMPLSLSFLLD